MQNEISPASIFFKDTDASCVQIAHMVYQGWQRDHISEIEVPYNNAYNAVGGIIMVGDFNAPLVNPVKSLLNINKRTIQQHNQTLVEYINILLRYLAWRWFYLYR